MGQRSQLYIRYNKKRTLVARHLQWNWGTYMINRATQILDYLSKNVENEYSEFSSKSFDDEHKKLKYHKKDLDKEILKSLVEMNLTIGSCVSSYNILEDYEDNTFKITPEQEDNNDGIFIVDLIEDNEGNVVKIKYGFSLWQQDDFKMITAQEYLYNYIKEEMDYNKNAKLTDYNKELEQALYIDTNFELLTDREYKEIFNKEYNKEWC